MPTPVTTPAWEDLQAKLRAVDTLAENHFFCTKDAGRTFVQLTTSRPVHNSAGMEVGDLIYSIRFPLHEPLHKWTIVIHYTNMTNAARYWTTQAGDPKEYLYQQYEAIISKIIEEGVTQI